MSGESAYAGLSEQQRRLISARVGRARQSLGRPGIPRIPRNGAGVPLSFAQQRIWFLHRLGALGPAFNVAETARFHGRLDVGALERAVNEVLRRHEALRTTIGLHNGQPLQRVAPHVPTPLQVEDLTALSPDDRDLEVRRRAAAELYEPWDLEHGPLLRARLLRLAPEEHVLLVVVHHIVSDGWSKGVLSQELAKLYAAFAAGQPSPLAELPIQYADYAAWQREQLSGERLQRLRDYWERNLAGVPTLQLPRDPATDPTARGWHALVVLPRGLSAAIREFSRRQDATLFMTLLAGYAALLSRYSGQDDIAVGSPLANRTQVETEELIGCFMNPLPLRVDLSGNPSFRTLVQRVRETALGCFAHQEMPFDLLVRTVQPRRQTGATPLFQSMFLLQNFSIRGPALAGLAAAPLNAAVERLQQLEDPGQLATLETPRATPEAVFPVMLELLETGPAIVGSLEYSAEYRHALSGAPAHFRNLLSAALADPDRPLAALPLLTDTEHRQVLVTWATQPADYPYEQCVHRLFEQQVARTPDAIAVAAGGVHTTYAELNRRANCLAHELRALGVTPESRVGILLERSLDLIVAVLGVMKAGGAYVPLDPNYPSERLEFIARDAAIPVLLTHRRLADKLGLPELRILCLDEARTTRSQNDENPAGGAAPENLVYVIYTSGSTGQPKGALIAHRSLANAYLAWEDSYRLRTDTRAHLQLASFSFDVFAGDFVRALCSGGKLVLAPHELLFSPAGIYELMRAEGVDAAEFVPAVLRNLLNYLEQSGRRLDFMKIIVAGSDTWYVGEYRRVQQLCGPQTRVINSYGLTEATIDSTWFERAALNLPAERVLPIGRPFGNTTVYIVDAQLQPVPAGVAGELCVGGPGLARGYLNRPELTAEKFIADPFRSTPGARLYRTGDLARWLPDGDIELLGRSDQQVKIRGIRVELGEIESLLSEYPGVRQVAALVREDTPGDRRLVVYLVADAPPPTPAALRDYLAGKLPQALHPAAYVVLETMPLTPNGKINRKALPAPDAQALVAQAFAPPETETERAVAEIWRTVLKVDRVGRDDNFFDLGGHSLLVVELHARLGERFGERMTIIELFELATVRAIAERLAPPVAAPSAAPAPPGVPGAPVAPVAPEDPQLAALRARAARQKQALGRGPAQVGP